MSCTYSSLCAKPPRSSGPGADQKLLLDGRAGELRAAVVWLGKQSLNNTPSLALQATMAEPFQRREREIFLSLIYVSPAYGFYGVTNVTDRWVGI